MIVSGCVKCFKLTEPCSAGGNLRSVSLSEFPCFEIEIQSPISSHLSKLDCSKHQHYAVLVIGDDGRIQGAEAQTRASQHLLQLCSRRALTAFVFEGADLALLTIRNQEFEVQAREKCLQLN